MPVSAVLAKFGVPVVIAAVGIAGFALHTSTSAAGARSATWIDAPATGSVLGLGDQIVFAHVTATSSPKQVSLAVDGKTVTSAGSLNREGLLAYAELHWSATAGTHVLKVSGPAGTSASTQVFVGTLPAPSSMTVLGLPSGVATASPTAHPSKTPTPTSSASSSSSSATSSTPTATRSSSPRPTITPTHPHTSTSTSVPAPVISSAALSPDTTTWFCGPVVTVTATITGASSAYVALDGKQVPMTHASGSTWTASLSMNSVDPSGGATEQIYAVSVVARGATGKTSQRSAGSLDVQTCKP